MINSQKTLMRARHVGPALLEGETFCHASENYPPECLAKTGPGLGSGDSSPANCPGWSCLQPEKPSKQATKLKTSSSSYKKGGPHTRIWWYVYIIYINLRFYSYIIHEDMMYAYSIIQQCTAYLATLFSSIVMIGARQWKDVKSKYG